MNRAGGLARLCLVGSVTVYLMVFTWIYREYVSPAYDYFGLGHAPVSIGLRTLSVVLAIVPSILLPIEFRRPSQLFFLIQYLVIFIPLTLIVYDSSLPRLAPTEGLELLLLCFAGLSLWLAMYGLPLPSFRIKRLTAPAFGLLFGGGLLVTTVYVLFKLGSTFRVVGLDRVYDVRAGLDTAIADLGISPLALYAMTWLGGLFLPVTYALGLFTRKATWIAAGIAGYILLFGIGGWKAAALAIVFLPVMYAVVHLPPRYVSTGIVAGLTALIGGVALIPEGLVHNAYLGVVHLRTFSQPALLVVQFLEFFKTNPVTLLSHVHGVDLLVRTPYDSNLFQLIGLYYYGSPMTANAGYWASDGIAGFGYFGILLVSAAAAAIMWFLDASAVELDPRFAAVAGSYAANWFANVPLTTTLLSGGLAFLMVTFLVVPMGRSFRRPQGPPASLSAA